MMATNPTDLFIAAHDMIVALWGADPARFAARADRLADTLRGRGATPGIVDMYAAAYEDTLRPMRRGDTVRSSGRSDPTGATVVSHELRRRRLDEAARQIQAASTAVIAALAAVQSAQLPDPRPYTPGADTAHRQTRPTAEAIEAMERRRTRRPGPLDDR
jgi:hypothetical protein